MSYLISRELVKSLVLRYQSEIKSAARRVRVENPKHLDELDEQIQKIAEANDKLETLYKTFPDDEFLK
tara:strand:+ start:795 stop:998 length:204 start_codon:yes stop_codon:yes gene_type:complete